MEATVVGATVVVARASGALLGACCGVGSERTKLRGDGALSTGSGVSTTECKGSIGTSKCVDGGTSRGVDVATRASSPSKNPLERRESSDRGGDSSQRTGKCSEVGEGAEGVDSGAICSAVVSAARGLVGGCEPLVEELIEKSDGFIAEACFGEGGGRVDVLGWTDGFDRLSDCESIGPGRESSSESLSTKMSSQREQWNRGTSRAATAAVSTAKLVRQVGHTTTMWGAGASNPSRDFFVPTDSIYDAFGSMMPVLWKP